MRKAMAFLIMKDGRRFVRRIRSSATPEPPPVIPLTEQQPEQQPAAAETR